MDHNNAAAKILVQTASLLAVSVKKQLARQLHCQPTQVQQQVMLTAHNKALKRTADKGSR